MERTPRPGWHGMPPSRDRFVPPVSLPAPTEGVTTTSSNAPPIWCELTYPDGRVQTVKGFAMAWTRDLVHVQWVEFSMARTAWVKPSAVRRRELLKPRGH